MSEDTLNKEKESSFILFFKKNKKILISLIIISSITVFGVLFFNEYKKKQNILISEKFNNAIILLELKTDKNECMHRVVQRDLAERGKFKEQAKNDFIIIF